jgi:hypothetical protein
MSTKCSIKWRQQTDSAPGFHLYEDVGEAMDGDDPPVYLRFDGVQVELTTHSHAGATVTVAMPREMARELGLLPAA